MVKCSQINGIYFKTNCFIICEVIAIITRTRIGVNVKKKILYLLAKNILADTQLKFFEMESMESLTFLRWVSSFKNEKVFWILGRLDLL